MTKPLAPERIDQLKRIVDDLPPEQRRVTVGDESKPRGWAAEDKAALVAASAREEQERAETPRPINGRREAFLIESAAYAPGPYGRFLWLDDRCTRAGLTPTSAWWRWATKDFFDSGKRWWYLEVGRGGAKSTTLERLAGALSMGEERAVPDGQVWEYLFVSVGIDDANRRIRGLQAVNARGFGMADGPDVPDHLKQRIAYSPRGHIDLRDMCGNEIRLSSIAGTIGAVSGPNSIGIVIDEAAKLRDKAVNANPLREIIASVISTTRARPDIYMIVCSSPWSTSGSHFDAIHGPEGGDNDVRHVARIGAAFVDDARIGLEAVASWEERGDVTRKPNHEAARAIRAHMATLTATSPSVPTWVALPDLYGVTPADRAIRLRREVEALPPETTGGIPKHMVWLREIASVPLDVDGGPDYTEQCLLAADITARLGERFGTRKPAPSGQVMKVPGARPGDARYAGPARQGLGGMSWRKRGVL